MHDGMKAVGVAGLAGGAAAGALTAACALGFTVGAPVLVPIAVVGGTAYFWVAGKRTWEALGDETRAVVMDRLAVFQEKIRDHAHTIRVR